jgi:osmotically-inducible protein OsmY
LVQIDPEASDTEDIMFARHIAASMLVLGLGIGTAAAASQNSLQIYDEVSRQVLRYPHFTIFDNVEAQVDGSVLTLTGKVTMPYKRSDIERRVANVEGVSEVRNLISVLPVSRFDDELRWQIARAIYRHPAFLHYSRVNPPIHIIVERGHVTLEGVVANDGDRTIARSIASSFGSFSLKTELKTDEEVQQERERL